MSLLPSNYSLLKLAPIFAMLLFQGILAEKTQYTTFSTSADDHSGEEEHHDSSDASILAIKISFLVLVPVLVLSFAFLPFCLGLCTKMKRVGKYVHGFLDIGQGFAAGVLVGGAVLHIYPETVEAMKTSMEELGASEALTHYPFIGLCALGAFCFIYFSEFILGQCLEFHQKTKNRKKHSHHHHGHSHSDEHEQIRSEPTNSPSKDAPTETDILDTSDSNELPVVPPVDSDSGDIHLVEVEPSHEEQDGDAHIQRHNEDEKGSTDDAAAESNPILSENHNDSTLKQRNTYNTIIEAEDGSTTPHERSSSPTQDEDIKEEDGHTEMCLSHQPKHFHDHHSHHFDLLVDHHASLTQIVARGLMLWVSLSIHSFLAGLGVGAESNMSAIWTLIVAILVHKLFEAYALGEVLRAGMKKKNVVFAVVLLLLYSVTSSIGVGIGMGVSVVDNPWFALVSNILLGFSVGALLHVGLFELLFHHMISDTSLYITIPYIALFLVGIGGTAAVAAFHDQGHGHEH